jgi:hypothetical protein
MASSVVGTRRIRADSHKGRVVNIIMILVSVAALRACWRRPRPKPCE